jgi:hypothetical protein
VPLARPHLRPTLQELSPPDPRHRFHAMPTLADWVLVDYEPAPTFLSEEPRCHSADDPVLVGAVVDLVRVHGPDGDGLIPIAG